MAGPVGVEYAGGFAKRVSYLIGCNINTMLAMQVVMQLDTVMAFLDQNLVIWLVMHFCWLCCYLFWQYKSIIGWIYG